MNTIEQAKKYSNCAWFLFASGIAVGMGYKLLANYVGCSSCKSLGYVGTFIGLILVICAFILLRKSNKIKKSLESSS